MRLKLIRNSNGYRVFPLKILSLFLETATTSSRLTRKWPPVIDLGQQLVLLLLLLLPHVRRRNERLSNQSRLVVPLRFSHPENQGATVRKKETGRGRGMLVRRSLPAIARRDEKP